MTSEPEIYDLVLKGGRVVDPAQKMDDVADVAIRNGRVAEKHFLKVDYRTNLADVATMARRMRAAGWTKRDISGEIEKNVDFRFLEKATGKSKAELTQW